MEISLIVKNNKVKDMGINANHVFIVKHLLVFFRKILKIKV